jgi:hypothetical protein
VYHCIRHIPVTFNSLSQTSPSSSTPPLRRDLPSPSLPIYHRPVPRCLNGRHSTFSVVDRRCPRRDGPGPHHCG